MIHYYKMLMLIMLDEVLQVHSFFSAFPRKYIVSRSQIGTGHGIRVVGTWNSGRWDVACLSSFFSSVCRSLTAKQPAVAGGGVGRWGRGALLLQRRELRRKSEGEEEAASTVELRGESWGLHDLLFTLVVSSRLVNIWMHIWPPLLDRLQFFFNTIKARVTWGLF